FQSKTETPEEINSSTYLLKNSNRSSNLNVELNLMPFFIDHHGESKISTYFIINSSRDDQSLESNFRGRFLHGTHLSLPIGYYGTLMSTIDSDRSEVLSKPIISTSESNPIKKQKKIQIKIRLKDRLNQT
ncbi:hypothetical protein DFH28DRAFT_964191, partial [Melampsora americana]